MDFYKRWKPNASEKQLVVAGQISTIAIVLLGILWIPFMKYISTQLYVYLQSVQAYISSPIAVVFILGLFWPRANGKGAMSALLTGLFMGGARFILEIVNGKSPIENPFILSLVKMNFLHFAILMFVVCSIVMVVVSLSTPAPSQEQLTGYTWKYSNRAPLKANSTNVILSVILVASVIVLWFIFR